MWKLLQRTLVQRHGHGGYVTRSSVIHLFKVTEISVGKSLLKYEFIRVLLEFNNHLNDYLLLNLIFCFVCEQNTYFTSEKFAYLQNKPDQLQSRFSQLVQLMKFIHNSAIKPQMTCADILYADYLCIRLWVLYPTRSS